MPLNGYLLRLHTRLDGRRSKFPRTRPLSGTTGAEVGPQGNAEQVSVLANPRLNAAVLNTFRRNHLVLNVGLRCPAVA